MKQTPTPAVHTRNASLNPIALMSPQRFATPVSLSPNKKARLARVADAIPNASHGITTIERVAEVTIGTDPQVLVRRAVDLVSAGPLRDFLASVMAERDVNRALTVLRNDGPRLQRLPIEHLRAAAQYAAHASLLSPGARDTLYAAILISGIELLLGQTVEHPYSSRDVIRSVVRDALRRLDKADEVQCHLLRNCLGWGNEDEMHEMSSLRMQYWVAVAVHGMAKSMALPHRNQS